MGKARSFSNESTETVYQTESNNENFALGSQQNSYNLGSVHFSDQSGIGNFSQSAQNSKFVNLKGSTIQGNIGFDLQTVELDVGTSTINLNNDGAGVALAVISQDRSVTLSTGSTSDLTTITGAQRPGQRVTLYNIFTNTITIKNTAAATVNTIVTPGAVDFSLSGNGLVTLIFDITLAKWRLDVAGTGGGGEFLGPWTANHDAGNFTLNNIAALSITDSVGGVHGLLQGLAATGIRLTLTAGEKFQIFDNITNILELDTASGLVLGTDIDFSTFDGTNIDRLLFSQTAGSSLTSGLTGITSNASSSMLFNVPSNTLYSFSSNALSILTLSNLSSNLFLSLFARDDEIPILQLTRLDSTPTVGTEVGRAIFVGVDSTGSTQEEFARITVDSEDLTIGSVDGSMHLQVDKASLTTAFISLNNSNDNKVSIFKNIFMQPGIDIELVGNDLIFDSTGTNLINADSAGLDLRANGSGDTIQMHSDGAIHTFSATSLQLGVTAELDLFTRSVGITPSTATFLADGTISYNSTANEFRFRQNGVDVTLGGGSQTPWLSDIDADGFKLQDSGAHEFRDISGTPLGSIAYIAYDAPNMFLNVPSVNGIVLRVNNTQKFGVANSSINMFTDVDFNGNDLILNANGDTIISTTASVLSFQIDSISQALEFQITNAAGSIHWPVSGFGHSITASTTNLQFDLGADTDNLTFIWATDTNKQMIFTDNHVDTRSDTGLFFFESIFNPTTPVDDTTFALYQWNFKNSVGTIEVWAQMQIIAKDVTNGTEDAEINYSIMNAGTLSTVLQMNAASGNLQMGFFGATPVAQQSPAATSAAIITALENLGLFV